MSEVSYLYGASVQGIQGFIFQTNKLKEIVGASELVDNICTSAFDEFAKGGESLQRAAGGVKFLFREEDKCKRAVLHFPKKVMAMAPGITISQAVVKMENEFKEFQAAVNELEARLRVQRNRPTRSLTIGLVGIQRSRATGLPAVKRIKDEVIDMATLKKRKEGDERTVQKLCKDNFGISCLRNEQLAFDINKITRQNDWIAIIHADGNGLGQVIQKIGGDKDQFAEFSKKLDQATKAAAVAAFDAVKNKFGVGEIIPIRPIVLSGDDHTLICRADLAIDYVKAFLSAFEMKTEELLGTMLTQKTVFGANGANGANYLTACAGIAFIKSSYPFYYGYHLSEELCGAAKKDAKASERLKEGLAQSCLMYHKVQDSFIEEYNDIVKRELITQDGISFNFGPYYVKKMDNRWTIDQLQSNVNKLQKDDGKVIQSHLRQWLDLLYDGKEKADQKIKRLKQQKEKESDFIGNVTTVNEGNKKSVPVYDMLVLNTIETQKTKEDKL